MISARFSANARLSSTTRNLRIAHRRRQYHYEARAAAARRIRGFHAQQSVAKAMRLP
jgi:hypothetical protein